MFTQHFLALGQPGQEGTCTALVEVEQARFGVDAAYWLRVISTLCWSGKE